MIAYFCTEFALDSNLKTYAGGLGILAGDMIREAADEDLDLIGIGLYYYKGYLAQKYEWHTPESKGLTLVQDASGKELHIDVPINNNTVYCRVWEYKCKKIKVYLLDTLLHINSIEDQSISYHLYDQDIQIRLAQQLILGIGGVRLVKALGLPVNVYHMNEGHAVFLSLEAPADSHMVFTNHTVIPEGNHMYANSQIRQMFAKYAYENKSFHLEHFIAEGACQYKDTFSLTHFAIKKSRVMNGVSRLHTAKLSTQYPSAHPVSVTNGIHIPSWDSLTSVEELTTQRRETKKRMLSYIAQKSGIVWEPQTLTICWSRRLIQYKRPLALFADIERLKKILTMSPVPVRIIIAGVPHPQDAWANDALHQILLLSSNQLNGLMSYLPEYNPDVSRVLVAGADVWLNTPVVGLEACGTSGMKASLTGSLTLSTSDGWMAEVDMNSIGWELGDNSVSSDIYQLLEDQIIPLWSQYVAGTSSVWADMMKRSRLLIQSQFSATRMVEEYRNIWEKS